MTDIKTASVLPIYDSEEKERLKDWLLVAGHSRDSDTVEESNFRCILKHLGGESETVEVHRFGHFAVGWVEEILVRPSRRAEVEAIKDKLDTYPVFDEMDLSYIEQNAMYEDWQSYGLLDLCGMFRERFDLMDESYETLRAYGEDALYQMHSNRTQGDEYNGQSTNFHFRWVGKTTREDMAKLLKAAHVKRLELAPKVQL